MCFSPEASFFSAAVLALVSVFALTLVKAPRQRPLALLPFFFACHQAFEGVVWLYVRGYGVSESMAYFAQQGYIFLAYLFFPVYFPFIAYNWETRPERRKWIALCLFVGLIVACAHLSRLFVDHIVAKPVDSSIQYPFATAWTSIPYLFTTCVSFLLCRDRRMWVAGTLGIVTFFIAWWIHYWTAASVWCFYAAWISSLSVWVLWPRKVNA